jgi:hypothetical protein
LWPCIIYVLRREKKAKIYVQCIVDLYNKGHGSLGGLLVNPGNDCMNYKMPGVKMSPVDWIGLASLRDSSNALLDYDSVKDQMSGITTPGSIKKWFEKSGFSSVYQNTNLIFDKGLNTLFEANTKYQSGASTCLFIGSSVFSNLKKGKAPADHWVVLNSAITLDGKLASSIKPLYANNTINSDDIMKMKIDFNVYTWGRANYKITTLSKSLTVNEFLDYFYGYVSAK